MKDDMSTICLQMKGVRWVRRDTYHQAGSSSSRLDTDCNGYIVDGTGIDADVAA